MPTDLQAPARAECVVPVRRSWGIKVAVLLAGAASFHLAFEHSFLSGLILLYAWALTALSLDQTPRASFYFGLVMGLLVFSPQLAWFWQIFGPAAVCLWLILSAFSALFVWSLNRSISLLGPRIVWIAAPVLWSGLEYFRGELYVLRFSWLSVGYAFSDRTGLLPTGLLGVYGTGFGIFLLAGLLHLLRGKCKMPAALGAALLLVVLANAPGPTASTPPSGSVAIAGMQLEFPPDLDVPRQLDTLVAAYPEAQILMLSEYTFDGPIPRRVRDWCKQNRRYLIAGGKDAIPGAGQFYNTAFVVGPEGEIVFKQAKSVPIQFFKDGLPARSQELWNSPWGKFAIMVCYDLSYRRVVDRFVGQGAQALLVPFMDVAEWGARQHELHARVSPVRAREYRLPVFRVGSSGISQQVDAAGHILAELPFPGQERMLFGKVALPAEGRLPLDRWFAPICTGLTVLAIAVIVLRRRLARER